MLAHLLRDIPLLLCDKRFTGILHNGLFALRSFDAMLIFVGELIGYPPRYISNIINGKKRLTEEMAERIANIPAEYEVKYGQRTVKYKIPIKKRVNADWLLCRSNDMTIYEAMIKRLDLASEDSKAAYDFLKPLYPQPGTHYEWMSQLSQTVRHLIKSVIRSKTLMGAKQIAHSNRFRL